MAHALWYMLPELNSLDPRFNPSPSLATDGVCGTNQKMRYLSGFLSGSQIKETLPSKGTQLSDQSCCVICLGFCLYIMVTKVNFLPFFSDCLQIIAQYI